MLRSHNSLQVHISSKWKLEFELNWSAFTSYELQKQTNIETFYDYLIIYLFKLYKVIFKMLGIKQKTQGKAKEEFIQGP